MNNKDNVTTGKPKVGGAVFRAVKGTTPPTTATSALSSAFICLGYISDDGLKNNESRTTQEIKAWGGDTVYVAQTDKSDTFTMTFIEALNPDVLKTVHGSDNVTGSLAEGLSVKINSAMLDEYVWVIDMILNGVLSEVTYDDDSAVGYAATMTAFPDTEGNTHYEYFKASGSSVSPDLELSSLVIGGVDLIPAFDPTVGSYTAATTASTNTITVTPSDSDATVVIRAGSDTIENGGSATWEAGQNVVSISVTNEGYTRMYIVNVYKH